MAPLKRILHVDDEDDIRQITKLVLESIGGFDVESCTSGRDALAKVQGFPPDLIILDVMMPEMDGPSTLEALRKLPVCAAIPVIFMTAKAQPRDLDRFIGLGAIGIITKPYDPQALPEQLQSAWARHCDAI